jgi:hypothetical protein
MSNDRQTQCGWGFTISVCLIDHGELDRRACNGGITRLGVLIMRSRSSGYKSVLVGERASLDGLSYLLCTSEEGGPPLCRVRLSPDVGPGSCRYVVPDFHYSA